MTLSRIFHFATSSFWKRHPFGPFIRIPSTHASYCKCVPPGSIIPPGPTTPDADKKGGAGKITDPVFPRPVRLDPGKVRIGFIPDEWFTFFYEKTGVTGPYTFFVALATYMISKEIYVLEHEYYTGLSMFLLCYMTVKKVGPKLARYLDKEIDMYDNLWKSGRENTKKVLEEEIAQEEEHQASMEAQMIVVQAKRENVALQLEAEYRRRLVHVHQQVKKRLDYQVEKMNVERRIAQKNLVDWVIREVLKSITPDQEKQNIDSCINALEALASNKT